MDSSPTKTCRLAIPVLVWIHSSDVSTTFSRSELVMTVGGAAEPIPMGRQPREPEVAHKGDERWKAAVFGVGPKALAAPSRSVLIAKENFMLMNAVLIVCMVSVWIDWVGWLDWIDVSRVNKMSYCIVVRRSTCLYCIFGLVDWRVEQQATSIYSTRVCIYQ